MTNVNPQGRVDILLLRLAQAACGTLQVNTGLDLWPQAKPVVEELIDYHGIPRKQINIGRTIAVNVFGILPQRRRQRSIGTRNFRKRRAA